LATRGNLKLGDTGLDLDLGLGAVVTGDRGHEGDGLPPLVCASA
jgi:hypothetical protein